MPELVVAEPGAQAEVHTHITRPRAENRATTGAARQDATDRRCLAHGYESQEAGRDPLELTSILSHLVLLPCTISRPHHPSPPSLYPWLSSRPIHLPSCSERDCSTTSPRKRKGGWLRPLLRPCLHNPCSREVRAIGLLTISSSPLAGCSSGSCARLTSQYLSQTIAMAGSHRAQV